MNKIMPNLAIVTQSYKGDLKECFLLCESIDRFVDDSISHYIFVNDEDYDLFRNYGFSNRHTILKKSSILPKYWINIPLKILGHKYYISPFAIPIREWIIQQICKLGAFEVIDKSIDAIINIDSETVFMRKFVLEDIYNPLTNRYIFFKERFVEEPCHQEYCETTKKLLNLNISITDLQRHCYMSHPVIFVKENIQKLISEIENNGCLNRSWKTILGNTYRFSEYYLYGIFSDYVMNGKNHYVIDQHMFPMIDISKINNKNELKDAIEKTMNNNNTLGVWLQKSNRNASDTRYFDFKDTSEIIKEYWNK